MLHSVSVEEHIPEKTPATSRNRNNKCMNLGFLLKIKNISSIGGDF